MSSLWNRLTDLESRESRAVQAVATGLFTAALPMERVPRRVARGTHVGLGLVGVAAGALGAGEDADPKARALAGALVGAAVAGSSVLGFAADGRIESWLRRRGVSHPRVVMGVGAALVTLAMPASPPPREG